MIAEFAGLPGSGKTTIARRLATADSRIETLVVSPALHAALLHPLGALRSLAATGVPRSGRAAAACVALAARRAHQDRLVAGAAGALLIEEGLVHHTWRELLRHEALRRTRWPALLASRVPVVVLTAPPEIRHARILGKRSGGPVNRRLAGEGPGGAYWQRAESLFAEVLAAAGANRPVVRVDTGGTLEQAVLRVREVLGRLP